LDSEPPPSAPASDAPLMPGAPPETQYISGFWRRLFAVSLDLFVLLVAMAFPAYRWFHFFSLNPSWTLLIGFALSFFYFVILNSGIGNGQTLGKKLLGLRVVNIRGQTISVGRSALRFLVLATPFFGEKVQFTCASQACPLTTLMEWIFGAWELVIVYLAISNRRTRQSLHDLAAGTFVVETSLWPAQSPQPAVVGDAASPYPVAPLNVTSQRIWDGHWIIIFASFVVALILGEAMWPRILGKVPYAELQQIWEAVQVSGKAQGARVTVNKNWRGGRTTTHLQVSFVPTAGSSNEQEQATEMAAIVLEASPKVLDVDVLEIVVLHSADFGIFHYSANRSFSHTPDQWRIIILASGTRKGGSARLKTGAPDALLRFLGSAQTTLLPRFSV
jgi:uncharacterized RDD family membrane protein YckC